MEATIVRLTHFSPPGPESPKVLATVNILGAPPITPERVHYALQTLALSSPSNRYSFEIGESESGRAKIGIKHQDNNTKRLNSKREEISELMKRMDCFQTNFNKYKEAQEREREKEKEPIYQWETWSRLAQAIHDFLKRAVVASSESDSISSAKFIWYGDGHSRYLPHLYTLWWVQSHETDPVTYPLPSSLSDLLARVPHSYNSYRTMKPLTSNLAAAITVLWESQYQPLLDVMLVFYLARDGERNTLQHPTPTSQFATEFVRVVPGLSSDALALAVLLIRSSTKKIENGVIQPFFDHGEGSEEVNKHALDEGLESWVSMQGVTGNLDQQDEEPPYKKAKFDT